jgi:hypothetical protein
MAIKPNPKENAGTVVIFLFCISPISLATSCRHAYRVHQHAHTRQLTRSLRHQSLYANRRQIACFRMILFLFSVVLRPIADHGPHILDEFRSHTTHHSR